MKIIQLIGGLFLISSLSSVYAQVGINTTDPQATLDIRSSDLITPTNTDGLLIPKIDEFPLTNPTATQDGMMVFVTGDGTPAKGFYYWENTSLSWMPLSTSASPSGDSWLETGNTGTDPTTNFIGTTDAQDLSFRTNNVEKMRLSEKGQLEFFNTGESVFIGEGAGENDDLTANLNVFVGTSSGNQNTTGIANTFVGHNTGEANLSGNNNSFFGALAGLRNTTGVSNSFFGTAAGLNNTTGGDNVAIGQQALHSNVNGSNNIALGTNALLMNSSTRNVAIGTSAGSSNTGSNSVFLGFQAGTAETNSNRLYIESSSSSAPLVYGEFDTDILRVNGTLEVNNPTGTGYALPNTDGTVNQVLQTNGNGAVSFVETTTLDTDDWKKTGNAGTDASTDFIGTIDAQDLSFRTGNFEKLRLTLKGQLEVIDTGFSVFIGENAGENDDLSDNANTFVGYGAGQENLGADSEFNSFFGSFSGNGYSGINNSYFGAFAGLATGGSDNSFFGFESGRDVIGFSNSSYGANAGQNIVGDNNSLFGSFAGNSVGGDDNTYLGYRAGFSAEGSLNTFIGSRAGETISTNVEANIFIGANTADNFTQGNGNVAIGNEALRFGNGNGNVVIGDSVLNTTGQAGNNVVIGNQALRNANGAVGSIVIGNRAGLSLPDISDRLIIHNDDTPNPLIYGEFINQVLGFNGNVGINHQEPLAALHVEDFGNSTTQNVIGILESKSSDRPTLLFAKAPPTGINDTSVGMSLEYDGRGADTSNKMVVNGIGGNGLFEFQNGGDLKVLDGDIVIEGTAGDRHLRMDDAAGNNDRVLLRQAGTNHIFAGDIDNNGGNFTIRTGGANAVTVLSGSRNVGIGLTNPTFRLQLSTNSAAKPTSQLWTVVSDRRLKKDVSTFTDGIETLKQIEPIWFTYNGLAEMPNETGVGTIAQELEQVAPYLVKDWQYTSEDGLSETYKAVDYGPLTFIMVNAIKEQSVEIAQLKEKLIDQKSDFDTKIRNLEERLNRLEN